ncbi:MAG TPA: PASTA domain-containing protein [Thermoanaerobaculia bacterium]|nr:PASTA domain-containing protein [Thermoanaerobaculia bacterium]
MSPALRKTLRALVFLVYAGFLAVVFVVAAYTSFSLFVRSGATPVPEITGLQRDEARGLVADSGLELEIQESGRYSEQVPAGRILSQEPDAREVVKRGSTVQATLSLGPQRLEVPALVGKSQQSAQVTLAAASLAIGRTLRVFGRGADPGTVVAQHPGAGELVSPSGQVDLLLAKAGGTRRFVMPDLVYRDYDEVRRFFQRAEVRLGRVTFEIYPGARAGTILRQFPLAGHPLAADEAVALTVAAEQQERGFDDLARPADDGATPSSLRRRPPQGGPTAAGAGPAATGTGDDGRAPQ